TSTRRRSYRSASTPASSPNSSHGASSATVTSEMAPGSVVCRTASSGRAIQRTPLPSAEAVAASQRSRKPAGVRTNRSLVPVLSPVKSPCDNRPTMDTRTPPRQQRSRDKYQRVLAATAELLEELPYEAIGTKLIASRAGVAVGSLYRFFVDKQAIVDALAQHWLDRLVELMDEQLTDLPDDPATLAARLVDG